MNAKIPCLICVLAMVTIGFAGCVPVSAENDSDGQASAIASDGITPMDSTTYHLTTVGNWQVHWYSCDYSNPNGGTHITSGFYKGYLMIEEAFQSGFAWHPLDLTWWQVKYFSDPNDSRHCYYYHSIDGNGYEWFGSSFDYTFGYTGGKIAQIICTVAFSIHSDLIYFKTNFREQSPGPYEYITKFDCLWFIQYQPSSVFVDGLRYVNEGSYSWMDYSSVMFSTSVNHWMNIDLNNHINPWGIPYGYGFMLYIGAMNDIDSYLGDLTAYYSNFEGESLSSFPQSANNFYIDSGTYPVMALNTNIWASWGWQAYATQ